VQDDARWAKWGGFYGANREHRPWLAGLIATLLYSNPWEGEELGQSRCMAHGVRKYISKFYKKCRVMESGSSSISTYRRNRSKNDQDKMRSRPAPNRSERAPPKAENAQSARGRTSSSSGGMPGMASTYQRSVYSGLGVTGIGIVQSLRKCQPKTAEFMINNRRWVYNGKGYRLLVFYFIATGDVRKAPLPRGRHRRLGVA